MSVRPVLTIAAAAGVLAAPAPALAAKTFEGKTQQDRVVSLTIGDDQLLQRFEIDWRTRRCGRGNYMQDKTPFRPPFDGATPDAFDDAGSYNLRQKGGYRIRVTIAITGKRLFDPANPAGEAWQGTVRATAVVRRKGKKIDTCTLRSIGWTAALRQ